MLSQASLIGHVPLLPGANTASPSARTRSGTQPDGVMRDREKATDAAMLVVGGMAGKLPGLACVSAIAKSRVHWAP
jgi:hypothetical protein